MPNNSKPHSVNGRAGPQPHNYIYEQQYAPRQVQPPLEQLKVAHIFATSTPLVSNECVPVKRAGGVIKREATRKFQPAGGRNTTSSKAAVLDHPRTKEKNLLCLEAVALRSVIGTRILLRVSGDFPHSWSLRVEALCA
jgi:hypothetical protein